MVLMLTLRSLEVFLVDTDNRCLSYLYRYKIALLGPDEFYSGQNVSMKFDL